MDTNEKKKEVLVKTSGKETFLGYITSETTGGAFVKSLEKKHFESDSSQGEWFAWEKIRLV
jgi:hypothetical protein